jgi:hypothetical protein
MITLKIWQNHASRLDIWIFHVSRLSAWIDYRLLSGTSWCQLYMWKTLLWHLYKSDRYLPLIYSQQHSNRNIIGEIIHNLEATRNCHITKQQKTTIKLRPNVWMNMSETPEKKKACLRYDWQIYICKMLISIFSWFFSYYI